MEKLIDNVIATKLDNACEVRDQDIEYRTYEEEKRDMINNFKKRLPEDMKNEFDEILQIEENEASTCEVIMFKTGFWNGVKFYSCIAGKIH